MFTYDFDREKKCMYIFLPTHLELGYEFLTAMSELIDKCLISGGNEVKIICIACDEKADYDKMSMAYLWNVCIYMSKVKSVRYNSYLYEKVASSVSVEDGAKFKDINFERELVKENLTYYDFHGDKDVQKPVDEIVRILIENNLTIESETVKEFLSTTVGEIFSNSINHSEQDEIFLMYDIIHKDGEFYLCINVIDYGATIVSNVMKYRYYEEGYKGDLNGKECMEWAIQSGHTTRYGSGGYGLPTLISYVKSTNGVLYILSDSADYCLEIGNEKISLTKGVFPGTSITFMVKLYDTERILHYDKKNERIMSINLDQI